MTNKKQSLYDIDASIAEALDALEGGSDIDAVAKLEAAQMARRDKVDAIAAATKSYEAHADILKEEVQRLQNKRRQVERKAEVLRTYLASSMLVHDEKRIDTTRFTVLCSPRPAALEVDEAELNMDQLAAAYPEAVRVKMELAKTEARKLVESGKHIPGISLVDGGYVVVLR